jgi:hypothetical protein
MRRKRRAPARLESSPRLSKRTLGDGASAATPGTPSTPEEWIARIRALMAAATWRRRTAR